MILDFNTCEAKARYKLMFQSITPRPIAWVVTEDEAINIAPYSFFSGISSTPPLVSISIGLKKNGSAKDTLANLRKHKKCVICSVTEPHTALMNASGSELEYNSSEAQAFGIELEAKHEGYPPSIKGVPTAMFCELVQEVVLEDCKNVLVILKINAFYADDALINEELELDMNLIGRMGKGYKRLGEEIKL